MARADGGCVCGAQLISKFCYNWNGVRWAKVVQFIRNRTGETRYTERNMKLLEFMVWKGVGFTLRPRVMNEDADTPLHDPALLPADDARRGILVAPIEKLELWQYDWGGEPDAQRLRARNTERMDRSLGWPISIATPLEIAILHHWLVSDFASLDINPR